MPGRLHAGLLGGGGLILARVSQPGPADQRVLLCGGPSWVLWGLAQPPWPYPLNARSSPSVMTTDVPDTAQCPGVQSRLGRASCKVTASLPSPCPASPTSRTVNSVGIWIKHIRVGGRGRGLMLGSGFRRKQGQKDRMTQRKCREGRRGVLCQQALLAPLWGAGCCLLLPGKLRSADQLQIKRQGRSLAAGFRGRGAWLDQHFLLLGAPPSHTLFSVLSLWVAPHLVSRHLSMTPPTLLCNSVS